MVSVLRSVSVAVTGQTLPGGAAALTGDDRAQRYGRLMAETITSRQFRESPGVEDWQMVFGGPTAFYRTATFADGAALVAAIGPLVGDVTTDVDLRRTGVSVQLYDWTGYTTEHVEVARRISDTCRAAGVTSDPSQVQTVQIALDALVHADVIPFWHAVLGYDAVGDEDVVDPLRRNPSIWFQQMDVPRPQRNRFHIDVCVPSDVAQSRVAAALAVGGRIVNDAGAPQWWTLADPEGNEVDVATWEGRD